MNDAGYNAFLCILTRGTQALKYCWPLLDQHECRGYAQEGHDEGMGAIEGRFVSKNQCFKTSPKLVRQTFHRICSSLRISRIRADPELDSVLFSVANLRIPHTTICALRRMMED